MNIPTYSNVPVMLVYFKLFYYDVALYPIFEVCNVLRVQISYKRVAYGSQAFPVGFALLFALNPQIQILRVNIHVGSARLRFVVRYRNGIYHDVLGFAVVRSFALCETPPFITTLPEVTASETILKRMSSVSILLQYFI